MDAPTVVTDITTAHWQPAIGQIGQVLEDEHDVAQCIQTILSTPKGADPCRPTFGFDGWQYLDWPINMARPHLVREIVTALAWEPRIVVDKVTVDVADQPPHSQQVATITWHWADDRMGPRFESQSALGSGQ